MLVTRSAVALLMAHLLPGLALSRYLGIGKGGLERWVMAAVMGGPMAALVYWIGLVTSAEWVYWMLVIGLDLVAVQALVKIPTESIPRTSRGVLAGLVLLMMTVEGAYFATTGHLFRADAGGNLVMDRALQRDTLFHVGLVHSLTSSYPPGLVSSAGVRAEGYHVGYHLQIAAWRRHFGIPVFDGIYRVGAGWSLALLVASTFVLGRRFLGTDGAALVTAALVFGGGFGFLFSSVPGVNWWSHIFMDAALVSIFLPNPLLPALSLLFVGLSCLSDYLRDRLARVLIAAIVCLVSLLVFKVFLGLQVLAGMALATLVARGENRIRMFRAMGALGLASLPLLWHTLSAASGGNTSVVLRPLEIVRYSMEMLGWEDAVGALARVGDLGTWPRLSDLGVALAATLGWVVGFLGLRALGVGALLRDLTGPRQAFRPAMAFIALAGFPIALVFRVGPYDAGGISRAESLNDVFWFATQSGILLWFWTGDSLVRLKERASPGWKVGLVLGGALSAFPVTIQHFVLKGSLDVDRVPAAVVEAADQAREISKPGEVWIDPPDRVRPSPVAYLAGRPVVYDGYVGYDYMFVPREERDFRNHAVAQFWQTGDVAYAQWLFEHYGVTRVFATTHTPLPASFRRICELVFSNRLVELYRVVPGLSGSSQIMTPTRIPMGLSGAAFFGKGWSPPAGSPRSRRLGPGEAILYLPVEQNAELKIRLDLEIPHAPGQIEVYNASNQLGPLDEEALLVVRPTERLERGLRQLELLWKGRQSLTVRRIDISTVRSTP